jgi:hypothetical protein
VPTINDSHAPNYAWAPTTTLGLVPTAMSRDGEDLLADEQSTFEHLSQTLESANALFTALSCLALHKPQVPVKFLTAHMDALERLYEIKRTDEMNDFIRNNFDLAAALFAVYSALRTYFPGKLTLDLLPAGEDSLSPQLVIYAHSHLNARDGRKLLTDFRREWWRTNYISCFKDLTISIAFECQ